jgi:uncharacterized repeat protein (TIGR01451 family)
MGGSSTDIFESVIQTKDGGYIVTGRVQSPDGDVIGNKGGQNAWVIKFSKLGTVEWQKCYGGSSYDSAKSIIQTADGGYAITGRATSRDGDLSKKKDTSEDAWVVKLSSLGTIEWVKNLGGSNAEEAYTIVQTSDGGFLMAGYSDSKDGDVKTSFGVTDGWLVKLSAQGVILWEKSYGSTYHDNIRHILPTLDGGYLLAGEGLLTNDVNDLKKGLCLIKLTSEDKVIKGQVQQSNTVCQRLTPLQYLANSQVKIEKNNNIYYTSSDSLGRFGVFADTGTYSISALAPNSLWTACPPQYFTISKPRIRDTTIVNPSLYINSLCPLMEVELTTPFLRRCFESQYVINYINRGTAIQKDAVAELTLDSMLTFVSANRTVRLKSGNKIIFSLGDVPINQVGQIDVTVKVGCDSRLGQAHCSSVVIPKAITCDTLRDTIPSIRTQCVTGCDSISFFVNRSSSTSTKTFKYQLIADASLIDTGRFLLRDSFNLKYKKDGRTYRLEIRSSANNQLLATRSIESNSTTPSVSTGFVNQFAKGVKISNVGENCTVNRGAFDPNDKAAIPTGVGSSHFVEQGTSIEYLVQFQNTGTDTAFMVVVKDTLSNHFDLSTFKLSATSHPATWQLNSKGILTVTFDKIKLVDSFTNEKGSHGFFKYVVKLNDSIATNTVINNKAGIYFDFNLPIITNITTHTIGKELVKNCLIKPSVAVSISGCPTKNVSFTATVKNGGITPTYAWYRNKETTPLSINALFTLNNAVNGTKIYCKTTASNDICTETPTIVSDTITLNCINTKTEDVSIVQSFDIYPNPNKGLFDVKLVLARISEIRLDIFNVIGQTIKTEKIQTVNLIEQYDLSTFPKGIYFIKLTIDKQQIIKKLSIL